MLKLPSIHYNRPQELSYTNPFVVAQSGSKTAGQLAKVLVKGAEYFQKREARKQWQDATLEAHKQDVSFITTKGIQDFYTPQDSNDPDFIKLTQDIHTPDGKIPAYRVYPEWRKTKRLQTVQKLADTIQDEELKRKFLIEQTQNIYADFARDQIQAVEQQKTADITHTLIEKDKALRDKDYGGAKLIIQTSNLPENVQEKALNEIMYQQQTNYFQEVFQNGSLTDKQEALQRLKNNDPEYTSHIPEATQTAYTRTLKGDIRREQTAIEGTVKTQLRLVKKDAEMMAQALWKGEKVNIAELQNMVKEISSVYPEEAADINRAIKFHTTVNNFQFEDLSTQQHILNKLQERPADKLKADDIFLYNKLVEAHEQSFKQLSKNAVEYADKIGFVHLTPISFDSPGQVFQGLKQRNKDAEQVYDQFNIFNGWLKEDEYPRMVDTILNASDPMKYFKAINEALGDRAVYFYDRLQIADKGNEMFIAGQLLTYGSQYELTAKKVLQGAKLRREDSIVQKRIKEAMPEIQAKVGKYFPSLFGGNTIQADAMKEAVIDLFAVTNNLDSSFKQIIGEPIQYNGSFVFPPAPDVTPHQFNLHILDIPSEYWKEHPAFGFPKTQLRGAVINGEVKLVGAGRGKYYLQQMLPDGRMGRVKNLDGTDYVLDYFDSDIWKYINKKKRIKRALKAQSFKYGVNPYRNDSKGAGEFNKELVKKLKDLQLP